MTIADHLRAVLGVLDAKAFRTPAQQDVIEAARTALADAHNAAVRAGWEAIPEALQRDMDSLDVTELTDEEAAAAVMSKIRRFAADHACEVVQGEQVAVVYGDSFADDSPRMRQRKAAAIIRSNREFESATSEAVRGMVAATPTGPRLALHQALIAQDVASVPQERAKSECAPPPGVTQERAATGTVERSGACDIVARSLVKGRETQKLALSTYGREAQQDQAIEECAELIVALRHYQRGVGSLGELQGEIADVLVTVTTLAIQYGDEAIAACVDYKLDRLRKRLGGR